MMDSKHRQLDGLSLFGPSLLILLLLSLLVMGGCAVSTEASAEGDALQTSAEESPASVDDEDKEEAVPVEVSVLGTGRMEQVLRYSANLEAEDHVQVFSQASRLIREIKVEEGDQVRKGDVLLRLQDEEQRNNLAKARSQLAKSQREYQRLERLFDEALISEQKISEATYDLEQLQIAVADAERELSYTLVTAPISGTVTSRLVKLGDQVTMSQHLFDIVDFDSMVARIYVPEKNLAQLKAGQAARITSQALGEQIFRGKLERIAPVVDPRTGTLKVTVAVGHQPGLLPGLYTDVALVTSVEDEALLMPKRALVYDKDRVFVFRLGQERRVERLDLAPTITDRNHVQVGLPLRLGDRIVIAGQAGLKDGTLVSLPDDAEAPEEKTPQTSHAATRVAQDTASPS